jgi:hypothetical protein
VSSVWAKQNRAVAAPERTLDLVSRWEKPCLGGDGRLHFRRSMADTQISAYISASTKEQVERYAESHGVKKGYLVEEALLHHLQALRELPADVVIPPRVTVSSESFKVVTKLIKKPRKPTNALRDLMAGRDARSKR